MSVILCNRHNFEEELIDSELPVVVYFWATLSGSSRALNLIFEELSNEYKNRIKFLKINSEENKPISTMFKVDSVPCIIVMKRGGEIGRIVGYETKSVLKQKLDYILSRIR